MAANPQPQDSVFAQYVHQDERIKLDIRRAGLTRIDATGRKLDFHALRYTFATKLASRGVSQRLAQELLRHSDPKLTANLYTDVTQLPTFAVVNALPWQAGALQSQNEAKSELPALVEPSSVIDPHFSDISGQNLAMIGTGSKGTDSSETPSGSGFGNVLAHFARSSRNPNWVQGLDLNQRPSG